MCPVKYFFCIVRLTGKLHVVAPHHMVNCLCTFVTNRIQFLFLKHIIGLLIFVCQLVLIDKCVFLKDFSFPHQIVLATLADENKNRDNNNEDNNANRHHDQLTMTLTRTNLRVIFCDYNFSFLRCFSPCVWPCALQNLLPPNMW